MSDGDGTSEGVDLRWMSDGGGEGTEGTLSKRTEADGRARRAHTRSARRRMGGHGGHILEAHGGGGEGTEGTYSKRTEAEGRAWRAHYRSARRRRGGTTMLEAQGRKPRARQAHGEGTWVTPERRWMSDGVGLPNSDGGSADH